MHIKTITIQGFKSYKDQPAIDPFSPRHNVVVGRNGSGKSNFFMAIRFVLGDAYEKMSREERAALLHEGTGKTTTLSAYVELVFDNTDGRFPTSLSETILRRTIGLKKDEYTLDRKSASKAEVLNLLESAGFSRSNPYYIVPQGRITSLTNMKDTERLDLLKEIAGTSVYENKRLESLRILEETNAKRDKIVELLERIEERLGELQEEQKELKKFQQQDKDRRCLEYTLYQRELDDVEQALERVEDNRRADVDSDNRKRQEFIAREEEIKTLEADLKERRRRLTTQQIALSQAHADLNDLIRARTELACSIDDIRQVETDGEGRREALIAQLDEVTARMTEVEREVAGIAPELAQATRREREVQQGLDTAQARLDALYAKQGRKDRFTTQEQRDAFLRDEVDETRHTVEASRADLEAKREQGETRRRALRETTIRRGQAEEEMRASRGTVEERKGEVERLKVEINAKQEQRKNLLKEDGKLEHTVASMRSEKEQADRQLFGTMDRVFGRTIVCPDLATCGQYTRSHGVSAITLDGDRVDRKGALTGGYLDTRRSRLDAIRASKSWNSKYEQETARQREIKQAIVRLEQEISIGMGNIQVAESEMKRTLDQAQPLLAEIHRLQREEDRLREQIAANEDECTALERDLQTLQTKLEAYEAELATPFTQTLSSDERRQMQELTAQVNSNRETLAEIELKEDLARRREELENRIGRHDMQSIVEASQPASLGTKENELNTLNASVAELEVSIDELQADIDDLNKQISNDASRLEEMQSAQMENSRGILKAQKAVERYITKRQTLLTRKDECNKSIRDLGVLPEEAYTKYVNKPSEQLVKALHKVNDALKGYSHVNKRAYEQYETFSKQKDDLIKRRDELVASGQSVDELVDTLDRRKDEAIERTFKQVSKYFAEIFERLVPAGRGKLRMQRTIDDDITVEDESQTQGQSQQNRPGGIASYTGVSIELADFLNAVAMIHELSDKAQFITTTFRPEMLAQADKFYGVLFNERKVSSIQTIRREDAQDFIENV
ncbi:hypothetical protein QFC19_006642 [Naganishia cerealis]|uniref:Uncharacterized protein n=1 Tax=Naganishia cerealis TaxID=610337 RepID=A0ACC2VFK6_9TREE|nr:hypothetical protein QFC19_006642 [Naganishia cerealis]